MQIKKRNGQVVDFNPGKISSAIEKAFLSLGMALEQDKLEEMTRSI